MVNPYLFDAAILAALAFVIYQNSQQERAIMSTQDQVDALTAQVTKVHGEVAAARDLLIAQVVSLKDELDKVGVSEQINLAGLQNAIQSLDDINPDTPAEVPSDAPADIPADAPADVPADVPAEDAPADNAPPF